MKTVFVVNFAKLYSPCEIFFFFFNSRVMVSVVKKRIYVVSVLSDPSLSFSHPLGDMLKPLFQHLKTWSGGGIQVPALFHDVIHDFRTAVRTVHFVAFLHSRHYIL